MTRHSAKISNTIAFRAPSDILAKLDADCQRYGISRGEMVRAITSLHYESQPAVLRDDLHKLLAKATLINRNQARTLVSLLTILGRLPLEDAKQIARTDLLS
jgi:hypothetical protein